MSFDAMFEMARAVEKELGLPTGALAGEGRRREFIRARAITAAIFDEAFPGHLDREAASALGRDRTVMSHYRTMAKKNDPRTFPEFLRCRAAAHRAFYRFINETERCTIKKANASGVNPDLTQM